MNTLKRSVVASLLGLTIIGSLLVVGAGPAQAADDIQIEVTIDGNDVRDSSSSDPIELDPDVESLMIVSVENIGDEDVEVEWIRLASRIFNLVFVATDTYLGGEIIEPDSVVRFEIPLRFFDLGSQATGLLPSEVAVYDPNHDELGKVEFTMDVTGSIWSVQGGLTIVLLIIAIWSGILLFLAVYKGTLPVNRLMRGLRFAAFGLSVGLFISFAVGVFGIVAPYPSVWVPALLIGVLGGFAVGYLWPVHADEDDDEEFDAEAERKTMLLGGVAAWRRSSQQGKSTQVVGDDPEASRQTQVSDPEASRETKMDDPEDSRKTQMMDEGDESKGDD
jgi:hypothetical protein